MDAACSRLQMMLMLRLLSDCSNCFSYTANRSEGCIQWNVMLLISGVQQTEYYNISNCLVLSSTKWSCCCRCMAPKSHPASYVHVMVSSLSTEPHLNLSLSNTSQSCSATAHHSNTHTHTQVYRYGAHSAMNHHANRQSHKQSSLLQRGGGNSLL